MVVAQGYTKAQAASSPAHTPAGAAPRSVRGYRKTVTHDGIVLEKEGMRAPGNDYSATTLPDSADWQELLRRHRASGTRWTDPEFPPQPSSLWRDATPEGKARSPNRDQLAPVAQWLRAEDVFHREDFVMLSFYDDGGLKICGVRHLSSEAQFATPPAVASPGGGGDDDPPVTVTQSTPTEGLGVADADHAFVDTARKAIEAAMRGDLEGHVAHLTPAMAKWSRHADPPTAAQVKAAAAAAEKAAAKAKAKAALGGAPAGDASGAAARGPPRRDLDSKGAPKASGPRSNFDKLWTAMARVSAPMQYAGVGARRRRIGKAGASPAEAGAAAAADRTDNGWRVWWERKEGYVAVVHVAARLLFRPPTRAMTVTSPHASSSSAAGASGGAAGSAVPPSPKVSALSCGIRLFDRASPDDSFVHPGDVLQGRLSDCWFLGALSVVAGNERLLLDVFPKVEPDLHAPDPTCPPDEQQYNSEGVYCCRFWREGAWRLVVVDDWIPCNAAGKPVFAQPPPDSCELWVIIAEKAYAKLNGCYENLVGGLECLAMQDLTGGLPLTYNIGGAKMEDKWHGPEGREELWAVLNRTLLEGALLSTSADVDANGILGRHAYGILDTAEVEVPAVAGAGGADGSDGGAVARLLKLRNPWGGGEEWAGDWSDGDERWALVSAATREAIGVTAASDGTWWMSLEDYAANFTRLEACELLRKPAWTTHRVAGEWRGVTAAGHENVHLCPQYHLHLKHSATVFVELSQPSRRPRGRDKYTIAVAPLVSRCDDPARAGAAGAGGDSGAAGGAGAAADAGADAGAHDTVTQTPRKVDVTVDMLTAAVYGNERSNAVRLELEGSSVPYAIVPCTHMPGNESRFFLTVYTHGTSTIEPCDDADVPVCTHCRKTLVRPYRVFRDDPPPPAPKPAAAAGGDDEVDVVEGEDVDPESEEALKHGHVRARVHDGCLQAYMEATSDPCAHCTAPVCVIPGRFDGRFYSVEVDGATVKVHAECYDAYRIGRAERCIHCRGPVAEIKGTYTGVFYNIEGAGRVHEECIQAYRLATAPACDFCGAKIVENSKFSGRYFTIDDDPADGAGGGDAAGAGDAGGAGAAAAGGAKRKIKVHAECHDAFNRSRAPDCVQCGDKIVADDKYSGRYYTLATGDKKHGSGEGGDAAPESATVKCHSECYAAYQRARAHTCFQCKDKIIADDSHDGRYFTVDVPADAAAGTAAEKRHVHSECYPAYRVAQADRCRSCGEPVIELEGKFTGRAYKVTLDPSATAAGTGEPQDVVVHEECWDTFQRQQADGTL